MRSTLLLVTIYVTFSLTTATTESSLEDQWHQWYNELFGDGHSEVALSARQILTLLMRLERRACVLSPELNELSSTDRMVVQFWYDASVSSFHVEECSPEHLNDLRQHFESHYRIHHNVNLKKLYALTEHNLVRSCGQRFSNSSEVLAAAMAENSSTESANVRAADLIILSQNLRKWKNLDNLDREKLLLKIARRMFWIAGENANTSLEFVEAWQNGPCKRILSKLSSPELKAYANFVAMMKLADNKSRDYCPAQTHNWVLVVETCQHFKSVGALNEIWKLLSKSPSRGKVSVFGELHDEMRLE